jgi:membrane protein implicated in regulation of membrane protease activity
LIHKRGRWHTVYSIISTVIEEAAIVVLLAVVLPLLGWHVPWWAIVIVVIGFAVFSFLMYRVGHPTVLQKPLSTQDTMIGRTAVVESETSPGYFVRIAGELWEVKCAGGALQPGQKVLIVAMKGFKLWVEPAD